MGAINYVESDGTEYLPSSAADLIMKSTSEMNCAQECFETAGCSYFFFNNGCNIIIGRAARNPQPSNTITTAGELSKFCPANPFVGSFTKQSSFYCKFLTTLEADDLIETILENNNVDSAIVKLGEWMIEKTSENSIFKATSTKVNLSTGNPYDEATESQAAWIWIKFTIQTHFRMGSVEQLDLEPTSDPVFDSRSFLARTGVDLSLGDALAELENIDKAVEEALKTPGNLPLPQNVTVAETTELETESLVQVSDSGDVSADCSSGTCECEEGFRKNNEGICQAIPSENQELSNQIDCYDGNNGGCSHHCNQVSSLYLNSGAAAKSASVVRN